MVLAQYSQASANKIAFDAREVLTVHAVGVGRIWTKRDRAFELPLGEREVPQVNQGN
jgi:hypothetical protein